MIVSVYLDTTEAADGSITRPFEMEGAQRVRAQVWLSSTEHFEILEPLKAIELDAAQARSEDVEFVVRVRDVDMLQNRADTRASISAVFFSNGRPNGFVSRAFQVVRGAGQVFLRAVRVVPRLQIREPPPGPPAESPPDVAQFDVGWTPIEPDLLVIVRDPRRDRQHLECLVRTPHIQRAAQGVVGEWHLPRDSRELVASYMEEFVAENASEYVRRQALVGAGMSLFDAAPDHFKEVFWELINKGLPLASILVASEEPYVPWELMVPSRPSADGRVDIRSALGVDYAIGRWLASSFVPPATSMDLKGGHVIAPTDSGLKWAALEATFVCQTFGAKNLLPASIRHFDGVLNNGAAGLVHFACHGCVDDLSRMQVLIFQSPDRLSQPVLRALSGVRAGLGQDKSFVFMNACETGRLTPTLIGAGGLAAEFIDMRAGAVVAPLWSVEDTIAHEVAKEFYDLVVSNPTVPFAELLSRIRRRAYDETGFADSYAAYCFYGDPAAVRTLPGFS
jgi:hypothetical protein